MPVIRSTYALDEDTVRRLEALARQWSVSKSEALRRAIRAVSESPAARNDRLAALDEVQASIGLSAEQADVWAQEVRADRRSIPARPRGK